MKTKLYHSTIGFDTELASQSMQNQLSIDMNKVKYSHHIVEDHFKCKDNKHLASREEVDECLKRLKVEAIYPFEIETTVNEVTNEEKLSKYCVRMHYNHLKDICLAIIPNRDGEIFVKTAWNNYKSDRHNTLNTSKYERRY